MRYLHSLVAIVVMAHPCLAAAGDGHRILFIKGGPKSGGFLEGGADEHLCSIFDYSTRGGNHGWGELSDLLRADGFELEQVVEGNGGSTPVDLAGRNLSAYSVIVFGSNNAAYGAGHVDAVETYVRNGGAALFISDANWGLNWGDAPSSDQHFLDRFGWQMNQDRGYYTLSDSDYTAPDHPVVEEVSKFEGEGVSPITITDRSVPGVATTQLAGAKGNVRRNTTYGQGPSTPATVNDCSLVVATVDSGRIAGHFDRNTFFNRNGAGTDIHHYDNARLARNLFAWLATGGTLYPVPNPNPLIFTMVQGDPDSVAPPTASATLARSDGAALEEVEAGTPGESWLTVAAITDGEVTVSIGASAGILTPGVHEARLPMKSSNTEGDGALTVVLTVAARPIELPGRIEAEEYRVGGEGVSYHDTSPGNTGGTLRDDDVDIEDATDAGGGYNVGWIEAGEWLAYDVVVSVAGGYDVTARVASAVAGTKRLHVEVDGKNVTGTALSFTDASGWQEWLDAGVAGIPLAQGKHELRIVMDTARFNVNYLDVEFAGPIFTRGDVNEDTEVNIADAIRIVFHLFEGGIHLVACPDAADANDDGDAELGDVIYILQNLFQDGPAIPPPHPRCGVDETVDDLECVSYERCPIP